MTTTVLAYFPSPAQGVWYLGPFPIRAYALCIIAGIIAALIIGDRRWVARGGERGVIYDIALWAVPFGLVGGRLYHVLTDWKTYFGPGGAGLGAALRIWEGGLGIWGAVALGAVGAWIGCRRKGIPLPAFGDAVAPGIVLAQAIGRLGNYFNQELYGRETTVPWGMEVFYRRDASGVVDVHSLDGVSTGQVAAVVHPTFLYEMIWNLLVFVFLLWADRKFRLGHGRLFALYVAAYCVGRFGIELMRDDAATHIAGIRINVFTAAFVFIGAVLYLLLAPKGREDPETLRGWEPDEDEDGESLADEWAEDLVSAAKGSGILAAATVAGEHEAEDSAAVGDLAGAGQPAEFVTVNAAGDTEVIPVVSDEASVNEAVVVADEVEAVEILEAAAAEAGEAEIDAEEAEGAEAEPSDDSAVIVHSEEAGDAVSDTIVVYESADVADDSDTVVVYEVDNDVDAVEHESHTVLVEHGSGETETVIDDGDAVAVVIDTVADADTGVAEPPETELVAHDAEPAVPEPVVSAEPEPEPEAQTEPAGEPEAEPEPVEAAAVESEPTSEPEPEPKLEPGPETKKEGEAKPEPEPEPAGVAAVETTAPVTADANGGAEEPKLGSTLKRLLWGSGSRGGK